MKNMLINYLIIKRDIVNAKQKGWLEVSQTINKSYAQVLAKQHYQLIVLDTAFGQIDLKLVNILAVGRTKLLILSDNKIQMNDVRCLQCKPLSSKDAYDFFIRQLGNKKLTVDQKKKLRKRLDNLNTNQLYSGAVRRVVQQFRNSNDNFVQFLDRKMVTQKSQLSNKLQDIKQAPCIFAALIIMSQWNSLTLSTCQFLLNQLKIDGVNIESLITSAILQERNGKLSVHQDYRIVMSLIPKQHIDEYLRPLVKLLLREAFLLALRPQRGSQELQSFFDATTHNPSSLLSVYLSLHKQQTTIFTLYSTFNEIRRLPQNTRLCLEEIYEFLNKGFYSPDIHKASQQAVCQELLGKQLTCLTIFVINIILIQPQRDVILPILNVILRSVNQRKNLSELDLEQMLLVTIALQLQLQILLEILIVDCNKNNTGQQLPKLAGQSVDKKIQQCFISLTTIKSGVKNAIFLLAKEQSETLKFLLPVIQFNMFVIELVRFTRLQPTIQHRMGLQQRTKSLLKLRKLYEDSQKYLNGRQQILQNHKYLKELVRLLVHDNYHLRIYTVEQIPEQIRYLKVLHEYLQNRIKCQNFLNCINSQRINNKDNLFMLNQLLQVHSNFQKVLKNPLPQCHRVVITNYAAQLKRSIQLSLQKKPIFTLLVAYPQVCQNNQKAFNVSVQFNLCKNLEQNDRSIIIEEKALTIKNLKTTLQRGSRYVCLWFEYSPASSLDLLMETDQNKDLQDQPILNRRQSYIKQSVDSLINALPKKSHYMKKSEMTIFVCQNHELAEKLSKTELASTVVNFTFKASSTAYEFYIKKIFQSQMVEYFVSNMNMELVTNRNNNKTVVNLNQKLRQIQLPDIFKRLLDKIEIFPNKFTQSLSATELFKKQPLALTTHHSLQPLRVDPVCLPFHRSSHNVYVYGKEDAFLMKLKTTRLILSCEDETVLNEFLNYIESICKRKHIFPGGIYQVDWAYYISDPSQQQSQPAYFLDSKLGKCLPLLNKKKSLIIMKHSKYFFYTQKKSTYRYIIKLLQDSHNISVVYCQNQRGNDPNYRFQKLDQKDFKRKIAKDGKILSQTQFKKD